MNDPTRSRNAARLLFEGVMVVASILVAFGLDAWWGNKEVNREMEQELANVSREIADNRLLVSREVEKLERIRVAANTLLSPLDEDPGSEAISVPDTLAWIVTAWTPTLNASFGALDALISSGRLAFISNQDLKTGLAGIRERFDDAVEEELVAAQMLVDHQFPLVSHRLDFAPLLRIDSAVFEQVGGTAQGIPYFEPVEYPNSLEVRNSIRIRLSWYAASAGAMRRLLLQCDELLASLPS